jgi:uroporphyrinogen-III synthase
MRLLVTRPEPDGARTAAALRARGHDVLLAPLLRMQSVDFKVADQPYAAVAMTSANAARALAGHPQAARLVAFSAFTVGRHTADAAGAAGFREVHSAAGDQRALAALIRARLAGATTPLLYLAGEDRAGDLASDLASDLAGDLASAGLRVHTVVAYRAVKATRFPSDVETALTAHALDGVLHFSRRTAQAYLDCAAGILAAALPPVHFCLSRQVSEPLAAAGAANVRIAPRPDEGALLDLVG